MLLEEFNWNCEVLQAGEPVLVDFWAPWCGPCLRMNPIMHSLARDWKVCKINIDTNQKLARRYRVSVVPTLLVFKGGKVVAHLQGLQSEPALRAELERWK